MQKEYNVVLYSVVHLEPFYEYSPTYLPLFGDLIEIEIGITLFKVASRILISTSGDNKPLYILFGIFIGEQVNQLNLDKLKKRLNNTTVDIEKNSYGEVLFPE